MDQQKLRTLVFEKTGVRIDVDDPVFALVALNEAVLAEAVDRHIALLDEATAKLAGRLRDGGVEGAGSGSSSGAGSGAASSIASDAGAATPRPAASGSQPPEKRIMMIAGAAAVLGALLVLLGQAVFFKPQPQLAPVIQAKELSEAQSAALRNAEKQARIVQKLDAKTRNTIQAEMQKP